jgi:hypothetical protein
MYLSINLFKDLYLCLFDVVIMECHFWPIQKKNVKTIFRKRSYLTFWNIMNYDSLLIIMKAP